jgi:hypothetical protein
MASVIVVLYRHGAPKLSQQVVSLEQYRRAAQMQQRGDVFVFSDGTPWHSWQLLGLFLGHKKWQKHAPRAPLRHLGPCAVLFIIKIKSLTVL